MRKNSFAVYVDIYRREESLNREELPQGCKAWVLIKDITQFKNFLKAKGVPKFISFSYPTEEEHYTEHQPDEWDRNGFDFATILNNHCFSEYIEFPKWEVHGVVGNCWLRSLIEKMLS